MGDLRYYIDQFQSKGCKGAMHRANRKDEDMLIVDLVIRRLGDHVAEIRIFKYEEAVRFEQALYARRDPRQVGNMAHDVRCQDHIGTALLCSDFVGELVVEEGTECRYPLAPRDLCDIGRRLDSEVAQAAGFEVPQHDA